jgi:hypothetical protein
MAERMLEMAGEHARDWVSWARRSPFARLSSACWQNHVSKSRAFAGWFITLPGWPTQLAKIN